MGTRIARTKLETKIKNQTKRIAELHREQLVDHDLIVKLREKLTLAEHDIAWQKKRVTKRDEEIKEFTK